MQRRLCHRTHQRPAHARPVSAGARYLIHLIQCPLGKMARCKAANVREEEGCKTCREHAEDLFSAKGSVAGGNECLFFLTAVEVLLYSLHCSAFKASYSNLY